MLSDEAFLKNECITYNIQIFVKIYLSILIQWLFTETQDKQLMFSAHSDVAKVGELTTHVS
jgi:hypothetical protein